MLLLTRELLLIPQPLTRELLTWELLMLRRPQIVATPMLAAALLTPAQPTPDQPTPDQPTAILPRTLLPRMLPQITRQPRPRRATANLKQTNRSDHIRQIHQRVAVPWERRAPRLRAQSVVQPQPQSMLAEGVIKQLVW